MVVARTLAVCALAAMAAGCVSVQQIPLTPTSGATLKDREITLAVRDKPDFSAFRSSTMALGGGLLAGAITVSEGNRIVAENQIEDPAGAISRALSASLEQAYQARSTARIAKLQDDDVATAARQNPGADVILDVRTINWMFAYFPTAWTRYRVMYSARLRLIDVKRSQVIAEGSCSRIPEEAPNAPTFDQLVADKAALLKRELGVAAEHCARVFGTGTLALAQPVTMVAALAPQPAPAASAAAPAQAQTVPSPKGSTLLAALGTPMPDDLALVAPASDVPPALAAFSGVWTGKWGLGASRQHTLVVERIDGRNARLVYSLGKAPPRAAVPDPTFSRVVGVFDDDGSLRATLANGAVVIYRLSQDRHSLVGDWTQNVQHFQGVLQRQDTP